MADAKVKAKLRELGQRSQDEQVNFFMRAFGDDASLTATEVASVATRFDEITGQKEAIQIEEPQALKLLTEDGRTLTRIEFREAFRKIDVDCNGRLSLTEFLLFRYDKPMAELFKDKGTDDLMSQLDRAERMEEDLQALKLARENKIKGLEERVAAGGVQGVRAKHELGVLLASDDSKIKEQEMRVKSIKQRAEKAVNTQDPFEAQRKAKMEEDEQRREQERAERRQSSQRLREKGSAFGL